MPLDPAREWLAAGITGLARGREWDAVATVRADGAAGEDISFVALPDGMLVLESSAAVDAGPFAAALAESIAPPYRALAVRRPGLWAVGAVAIEVERLDPDPRGSSLELTFDGTDVRLVIDGIPADPMQGAALERMAVGRVRGAYAAHAERVAGDLWELSVRAL